MVVEAGPGGHTKDADHQFFYPHQLSKYVSTHAPKLTQKEKTRTFPGLLKTLTKITVTKTNLQEKEWYLSYTKCHAKVPLQTVQTVWSLRFLTDFL
jgi:hypothetical protein